MNQRVVTCGVHRVAENGGELFSCRDFSERRLCAGSAFRHYEKLIDSGPAGAFIDSRTLFEHTIVTSTTRPLTSVFRIPP